jgi:hypothetical protein
MLIIGVRIGRDDDNEYPPLVIQLIIISFPDKRLHDNNAEPGPRKSNDQPGRRLGSRRLSPDYNFIFGQRLRDFFRGYRIINGWGDAGLQAS